MKVRSDWLNTTDTGGNQFKPVTAKVEKLSDRERFFMNQNGSEIPEKTNNDDEIHDAILTMKENDKYRDALNSKTSEDIATNNNESLAAFNSSPCNGLPRKCSEQLDSENMNNKQNLYKNSTNLRNDVPSDTALVKTYDSYKCTSEKPIINGKYKVSLPQQPKLDLKEKVEETVDNEKKGSEPQSDFQASPQKSQEEVVQVNGRAEMNGCTEIQPNVGEQEEASHCINTSRISGVGTGSSADTKSNSNIIKEAHIDAKAEACPEVPTKEKGTSNSSSSSSSRVFRFVRMFNRKDVDAGLEGGERSSGKKNQRRVWGMCLQVQSPTAEEEERMYSQQAVNEHVKKEKDSVKSEPLLDHSCSERDSNTELGKTSSFNGIECFKNNSLDTIMDDDVSEKKKSMKLPTDKKNMSFMRSTGGRRSFDKPERPSKLVKPRSSTLEDIINSNDMSARSSKTLPATPTSGTCTSSQDNATSHPFYRRFYSHCMVLPLRRKKKEGPKKPIEAAVGTTVIDKSPQRSAELWDGDTNQVERTSDTKVSKPSTIEKEEEFEDSPKKLPVIDDLLAEIMESVTLMDIDLKENEDKLAQVPAVIPEDIGSTNETEVKGWESIDGAWSLPSVPEPEDTSNIDLDESVSKVGSLISKFEHGSC
ncbi:hypothetical protein Pcinc_026410 [Petrolisthes cinctipes]|uniref:Uncharacterized protein n=1 Tax=Petrolisthes cinctipes TaxID=88211 RepID=A0AAE1F716_PETCI|nr:hypothetical protein Pcinc_026410 [Petrolisthes cinctipes]